MGGGPVHHEGAWWQQRDDGTWLRWNEQTSTWEPQPPAPPQQQQQAAWGGQQGGQGWGQQGHGGAGYGGQGHSGQPQAGWGQPAGQGPSRDYAEWWQRLVAAFIDGFILAIPLTILNVVFAASAVEDLQDLEDGVVTSQDASSFLGKFALVYLLGLVITMLYFAAMHAWKGQSVGKMALGIKVVDERTGGLIGFGRGLWRYGVTILFMLAFGIPLLINYLSPLWDDRNQAWHDKAAKSLVVKTK